MARLLDLALRLWLFGRGGHWGRHGSRDRKDDGPLEVCVHTVVAGLCAPTAADVGV